MKSFFENYFENIVVFAYVRTPVSYMTSLLQQVIKSGIGFERLIKKSNFNKEAMNFEMLYPNYKRTVWQGSGLGSRISRRLEASKRTENDKIF